MQQQARIQLCKILLYRCRAQGGWLWRKIRMDNYRERSRRHSQYSDFEPNNDSTRENFGSHQARSSKSNSGSPKSHRHTAQSISFECKVCLNTYKNNKELYHHLHAAQHLRPLSRLKTAEETESYQSRKRKFYGFTCKVCDAEFSSHSALKTHINVAGHHWSEKRARHLSKHQNDSCNENIFIGAIHKFKMYYFYFRST